MEQVRSADETDPAGGAEWFRSPWWYHLLVGVIVAAASVVVMLAPGLPGAIAVLAMAIANAVLTILRRRFLGDPPPAFRGRALPATVSGIVLSLGLLAAGWYLVFTLGIDWVAWLIGAGIFVVIVVFGSLAERAPVVETR